MDKSVIALLAAMGAAAPFAGAQAAVSPEDAQNALRVSSVADLLEPVPGNAAAVLAALGEGAPASTATAQDRGVQEAQFFYHHHHHHHHHFWHHHHHHHHHWWRWCRYHPYAPQCN